MNKGTTAHNKEPKMKLANAIKKLEKAGYKVENTFGNFFKASIEGQRYFIQFLTNGGSDDIATISVKPHNDRDDVSSDYSSGVWVDNISQAIRLAY